MNSTTSRLFSLKTAKPRDHGAIPEDYKEDGVGNMDAAVFFREQQIKLENY